MHNERAADHDDGPADGDAGIRAEIVELTEHIQVLSLERGTAERMRTRAMVRLHREGAGVEELSDLTGMHPDDVMGLVRSLPVAPPPRTS